MSEHILRRLRPALVAGTGVVVIAAMSAAPALAAPIAAAPAATVAAAPTTPGYAGDAYGTQVTVGTTVSSGPSSSIIFGCGTPAGFHPRLSAASATVGSTLSTGTVVTSGDTGASPTRTATSARIQNLSLLGGLVTASAISSVSTVTAGPSGFQTSSAGTTFANLKVAGIAVPLNPQPNTTIAVPGVGRVVVNEQIRTVSANSASFTVNGLHVVVDDVLGLGLGTDIVVSHANSALTPPQFGSLTGIAYATQATVGPLVVSALSFPESMPCTGTNGAVLTNTAAAVTVPNVLTTGTISDTARGTSTDTNATGQTTSTIQSVNLLGGLITATGVKAVANATKTTSGRSVSDTGTTFASITVNGRVINPLTIARNTRISIAGVGTLYLRRTLITGNQIEVRMIELDVNTPRVAGVPTGTTVLVGVARAGAV